jgi:hypothetical protein
VGERGGVRGKEGQRGRERERERERCESVIHGEARYRSWSWYKSRSRSKSRSYHTFPCLGQDHVFPYHALPCNAPNLLV